MMGANSVPVDLLNPGQVFACLGLLEAAGELCGEADGAFDWTDPEDVRFRIRAAGDQAPVVTVLQFLDQASVTSITPRDSDQTTEKWNVATARGSCGEFPSKAPSSPATLPACLENRLGQRLVIDYWGDTTQRDNVKFWAGSGGYPGAALVRDALSLVEGRIVDHASDPFALTAEQSSSFRFDWRRDYVPIDAGFSPNVHGNVVMQGYPLVELLAAIGLSHARPFRYDKLHYSYGVIGAEESTVHPAIFVRAALGARRAPIPGIPFRLFRMNLKWPGQENQARCITNVIEETQTKP